MNFAARQRPLSTATLAFLAVLACLRFADASRFHVLSRSVRESGDSVASNFGDDASSATAPVVLAGTGAKLNGTLCELLSHSTTKAAKCACATTCSDCTGLSGCVWSNTGSITVTKGSASTEFPSPYCWTGYAFEVTGKSFDDGGVTATVTASVFPNWKQCALRGEIAMGLVFAGILLFFLTICWCWCKCRGRKRYSGDEPLLGTRLQPRVTAARR